MWYDHWPFSVDIHAASTDEAWLTSLLVLEMTLIVSREALLYLPIQIDHILELVEDVLVCLFQPTLAS